MLRFYTLFVTSLIASAIVTSSATAALSPGNVKRQKDKAPEVLKVDITKVAKGAAKGEDQRIVYTARITAVVRSQSNYKVGTSIKINSYIRNPEFKGLPEPGAVKPSLHKAGWTGTVYMRPLKKKNELEIAVFGHSFE